MIWVAACSRTNGTMRIGHPFLVPLEDYKVWSPEVSRALKNGLEETLISYLESTTAPREFSDECRQRLLGFYWNADDVPQIREVRFLTPDLRPYSLGTIIDRSGGSKRPSILINPIDERWDEFFANNVPPQMAVPSSVALSSNNNNPEIAQEVDVWQFNNSWDDVDYKPDIVQEWVEFEEEAGKHLSQSLMPSQTPQQEYFGITEWRKFPMKYTHPISMWIKDVLIDPAVRFNNFAGNSTWQVEPSFLRTQCPASLLLQKESCVGAVIEIRHPGLSLLGDFRLAIKSMRPGADIVCDAKPLVQLYRYMAQSGVSFGAVTSWNDTVFACLNRIDGQNIVRFSRPINVRSQYPYFLQAWLLLVKKIASGSRGPKIVPGLDVGLWIRMLDPYVFQRTKAEERMTSTDPAVLRTKKCYVRWNNDKSVKLINSVESELPKLTGPGPYMLRNRLTLDDVRKLWKHPMGCRAGIYTYRGTIGDIDAAFKIVDIDKDNDGVGRIANEVRAYHVLRELQGNVIPQLLFCQLEYGMFILATEFFLFSTRYDLEYDSDGLYLDLALKGLQEIYKKGILHNEAVPANLLVNRLSKKVCWINLGLAGKSSETKELEHLMLCAQRNTS